VWTGAPDQCQPLPADTLDRLKALIERSKAAARVKSGAQPRSVAPSPSDQPQGPNDFQRVNAMALALLDAWVPALFPTARRVDQGFRVRQADLPGRSGLEEDLSITRDGIRDFGVHDMGDAKEGRRSAIDLVVEWRGLSGRADPPGAPESPDPRGLGQRKPGVGGRSLRLKSNLPLRRAPPRARGVPMMTMTAGARCWAEPMAVA